MALQPAQLAALGAAELNGSGTLSWDAKDGLTGVRKFKILWRRRFELLNALAGLSLGGAGTGDDWPDQSNLIVQHIDVEPFSGSQSANAATWGGELVIGYEFAMVTATYKTFPIEVLGNGSAESQVWKYDFSAQFITTGHQNWKWQTGNKPVAIDAAPGILIPNIELSVARQNYPSPPLLTLLSLVGSINSTTFLGAAAEKVLYLGGVATRKPNTATGGWLYDIDHKFVYRTQSHNKFFNPDTGGGWDYLVNNSGVNGGKVYPAADLSPVLA